jgi:hypothetical protein
LTPTEQSYYRTLDPASAKSFILTRSYVRLCQRIVDHKLPALQLPDPPVGFSPEYFLPEDQAVVDQAIKDQLTALMQQKMQQNMR